VAFADGVRMPALAALRDLVWLPAASAYRRIQTIIEREHHRNEEDSKTGPALNFIDRMVIGERTATTTSKQSLPLACPISQANSAPRQ
jgi:hypothetical protein